jgi:hypothetical protein
MRIIVILFVAFSVSAMGETKERKFLESYSGQSTEQLVALAVDYRVDSLVLAFEQALDQKRAKGRKLSQPEIDILAVQAMEREVNNGGYHQFFVNSSKEHAAGLPASLERIGCPIAAKIASDSLGVLNIEGVVTDAKIAAALKRLGGKVPAVFGGLDERYFKNQEPIADRLFAYIRAKKAEIVLQ